MKTIQPLRHGVIKKFFNKFKYSKRNRELLFKVIEASEEQAKDILADEYVHFMDAIPEIRQFLAELEAKELLMTPEERAKRDEEERLEREKEEEEEA